MTDSKSVSIVIPVYNASEYLSETVESFLRQTYDNWEMILVNDGSTDDSLDIIKKYSAQDSRIRYIDKQNEGISKTKEAGLRIATGDYLLFFDNDDIFPEYKKTDVVVSCSRMETFGRTIAEARICGLPVIAAKAGAIPEQVNDGIDGLLFEPGDIAGLAQRLKECSNAEYRKRLSDNIPADLKARFSKERFASEFCRLTKTEKEHENLQ